MTGGADGAAVAALVDGPWVGCWYWRDDLEAQQRAAREVHARGGTAELGDKAHYRPTDRWVDNPGGAGSGRAWTYTPPRERETPAR